MRPPVLCPLCECSRLKDLQALNVKQFKDTCQANTLTRALNKRQTDRHTDGTNFMPSTTDAGGKYQYFSLYWVI